MVDWRPKEAGHEPEKKRNKLFLLPPDDDVRCARAVGINDDVVVVVESSWTKGR